MSSFDRPADYLSTNEAHERGGLQSLAGRGRGGSIAGETRQGTIERVCRDDLVVENELVGQDRGPRARREAGHRWGKRRGCAQPQRRAVAFGDKDLRADGGVVGSPSGDVVRQRGRLEQAPVEPAGRPC
jgi:hypothetical protein